LGAGNMSRGRVTSAGVPSLIRAPDPAPP